MAGRRREPTVIARRVRITAAERLPAGRVSAAELLALLHAEADRTGDERLRVTQSTLRTWKNRTGVPVSPGKGYDVHEVYDYLRTRGDRGQRRADRPAGLTADQST
ncbi:hypothetical protein [Saccharothrix lopnurensis]|uniref:Uncharacterized protein n=1 Tax=Saccharothrix lopnurensis TaxID=1670621 RepID=A0ABW1P386_9PSEU